MKKEKFFEIGKMLGITENDIKKAFKRNRNKIITVIIIGIAAIFFNKIWFEPLHYTVVSKLDFDFFTRFF